MPSNEKVLNGSLIKTTIKNMQTRYERPLLNYQKQGNDQVWWSFRLSSHRGSGIAPKAQSPDSRSAPGAMGTPLLAEASCGFVNESAASVTSSIRLLV